MGLPPATWVLVILAGGFLLFQGVHTVRTLGGMGLRGPDRLPAAEGGLVQGVYRGAEFEQLLHLSVRGGEIHFPIDQQLMEGGWRPDDASVRLSGDLVLPGPGDYTIFLSCDDGARLYIGGERLLEAWPDQTLAGHPVVLEGWEAGRHSFLLEVTNSTSLGWVGLEWEGPGFSRRRMTGEDFRPGIGGGGER